MAMDEEEGDVSNVRLIGEGDDGWRMPAKDLAKFKASDEDLANLRRRRPRSGCSPSMQANKDVMNYYVRQNKLVDGFGEAESVLEKPATPGSPFTAPVIGKAKGKVRIAMSLSFGANILLLMSKVVAFVLSGSLALFASMLDSVLDLLSGAILFFTERQLRSPSPYHFPVGKSKMIPLGVVIFSSIMGTVGFTIMVEALRELATSPGGEAFENFRLVIGTMISVIFIKFALFLYCRTSSHTSVQSYAQDHRNDVLTNSFGLAAAALANEMMPWIDPLGALIISLYITVTWAITCRQNAKHLISVSAPPELLQKLTYLALKESDEVRYVDKVLGYTFGERFFVEVDIVLSPEMPLRRAHDIGEELQQHLEQLPEVERAHVHIDFESSHKPAAEHKN